MDLPSIAAAVVTINKLGQSNISGIQESYSDPICCMAVGLIANFVAHFDARATVELL